MDRLNVLITGANGFIAGRFIKELDRQKFGIYGLDQVSQRAPSDSSFDGFYIQDITRPFKLKQSFDFVFHFAALNVTHVGKAGQADYHKVNVQGTENLIKAVQTGHFVFMSTAKVYAQKEVMADESAPIRPKNDYEKSKLAAEDLCRKNFSAKNLTIFRSVNIVGPGQAEKAVIPVFFGRAVRNEPIEIFVSRKTQLQLLDVEDAVEAFRLLIEKKTGGTFNLAAGDSIAIDTLAEDIVRMTGSRSPITFSNTDNVRFCRVVAQKAKWELGWSARVPVQKILKRYHASLKGQQV